MIVALAAAALLASAPTGVDRPISVTCRVLDATGRMLTRPAQLYTGRHDRRFALAGQRFLDMRYDALADTVAVTVVDAPHAPWTFGERVVAPERVIDLSNQGAPLMSLDAAVPGARLICGGPPKPHD